MSLTPRSFEEVSREIRGKKILVANRGIPARRIVRSVKEVFQAVPMITATDVDKTAPFTARAHRSFIHPGGKPQGLSGYRHQVIADGQRVRNIAAIHPGWGFASEDDTFPARVRRRPASSLSARTTNAMRLLGNKVAGPETGPRTWTSPWSPVPTAP